MLVKNTEMESKEGELTEVIKGPLKGQKKMCKEEKENSNGL